MSEEGKEEQGSPVNKRLRLMETDLRVIVGRNDNDDNNKGKTAKEESGPESDNKAAKACTKKEYHHYAAILASQSSYIDAMLSSPMKEGTERVIHFPDLDPDTWEEMIKFLQPDQAQYMQISDIIKVLVAYDKYDFTAGKACCDAVLAKWFRFEMTTTLPSTIQVDMYQLAVDSGLLAAKQAAVEYFCHWFQDVEGSGRNLFTESMLATLGPLLGQETRLDCSWTPERTSVSTFPQDFMERIAMVDRILYLTRKVSCLRVKIPEYYATVRFLNKSQGLESFDGWRLYKDDNEWVMRNDDRELCFKCPCVLKFNFLPPHVGWVRVMEGNDSSSTPVTIEFKHSFR